MRSINGRAAGYQIEASENDMMSLNFLLTDKLFTQWKQVCRDEGRELETCHI